MSCPCKCGNCRLCWLVKHRPEYAEKFNEEVPVEIVSLITEMYDCIHFGERIGKAVKCMDGCVREDARVSVFSCALFGECTKLLRGEKIPHCCKHCTSRNKEIRKMKWAYGVTTVPERKDTLLPRTLASLAAAGFDKPRLFIDGANSIEPWANLGLDLTLRYPRIRTHGNFVLGLYELFIRDPDADRYVMFQDDILCVKNLKEYLEVSTTHEKCFWSLFTFPINYDLAKGVRGWFRANQLGKGAVGLVFSREGLKLLVGHQHMVDRVENRKIEPRNGWHVGEERVDGGVVESFKKSGWTEMCHNPSLTQHIGDQSTMGHMRYPEANSFPGAEVDVVELMKR